MPPPGSCWPRARGTDPGDAGEILRCTAGFWAFVFHRGYRGGTMERWREVDGGARGLMVLEGAVAALIGLGLPLLVAGIILGLLQQG